MSHQDIEQISLNLKGLSIAATVSSTASGTTTQLTINSDPLHGPVGAVPAGSTDSNPTPSTSISAVDLDRLSSILSRRGGLSAEQRVQLAYSLGQEARRARLEGGRPDFSKASSVPPTVWVLLAHPSLSSPRWYRTVKKLRTAVGKRAPDSTIFCALPSQAEAESFCLGAGLEGLPAEA